MNPPTPTQQGRLLSEEGAFEEGIRELERLLATGEEPPPLPKNCLRVLFAVSLGLPEGPPQNTMFSVVPPQKLSKIVSDSLHFMASFTHLYLPV